MHANQTQAVAAEDEEAQKQSQTGQFLSQKQSQTGQSLSQLQLQGDSNQPAQCATNEYPFNLQQRMDAIDKTLSCMGQTINQIADQSDTPISQNNQQNVLPIHQEETFFNKSNAQQPLGFSNGQQVYILPTYE